MLRNSPAPSRCPRPSPPWPPWPPWSPASSSSAARSALQCSGTGTNQKFESCQKLWLRQWLGHERHLGSNELTLCKHALWALCALRVWTWQVTEDSSNYFSQSFPRNLNSCHRMRHSVTDGWITLRYLLIPRIAADWPCRVLSIGWLCPPSSVQHQPLLSTDWLGLRTRRSVSWGHNCEQR